MIEHFYVDQSRTMPVLRPEPTRIDGNSHCSASQQPMFCFKELEVDRVRYEQWKAELLRPPPTKRPKISSVRSD